MQPLAGLASWYGTSAHGKKTASGRFFHHAEFTAAHRVLPFGTVLRVYNLANTHRVLVMITDRGPFVRNRVIDVSYRAARVLNFVRRGVTPVWAEVVGAPDGTPLESGRVYYLQFGLRPDMPSALELQRDLRFRLGMPTKVFRSPGDKTVPYHVCAGPWKTFGEAEDALEAVPTWYQETQIVLGPETGDQWPRLVEPDAVTTLRKKPSFDAQRRQRK